MALLETWGRKILSDFPDPQEITTEGFAWFDFEHRAGRFRLSSARFFDV
jgi:hypothetical protein